MEVLVVIKIQANVLARTILTNALALSVKMVSTHFLSLLKWTVFSVTVIMEEALRRSVKRRMVCIKKLQEVKINITDSEV